MHAYRTRNAEETAELGRRLGARAPDGAVVSLRGELGAGKTVLARGIARGLGVTSRVQSPTFVIVQAHEGGRVPFWHADLYRLAPGDLVNVGLDELFGHGVVVVEWGDRFEAALPADRLDVAIAGDGDERTITLSATGPRHAALEVLDA